MQKTKIITSLMIISLLAVTLPTFVYAAPEESMGNTAYTQENPGQSNNEDKEQKKLEFKCEITSSKMDALMNRYQTQFEKHKGTYANIGERLQEVLDQLETNGYDVDASRQAVNQFIQEVEETQTEFDGFIFQMQQAKNDLCEEENVTNFRQSLNQSRNQLRNVRGALLGLRSKYQEDVKPHLLALREQVRDSQDDTTPGDVEIQ